MPASRAIALALTLALFAVAPPGARAADYEGFGATTRGGESGAIVRVTTLAESGPGSLRDAVAGGGRHVVFDVAGTIPLSSYIEVKGAFVTIDGSTAPAPGITLEGHGVAIHGTNGAHDVIVTGLRIRGAVKDGLRVAYGASNVVIDHVSIQGSGDGNLDISESRDVTVSWSVLAEPALTQKNMLIKYNPARVTLHHNLFTAAQQRNPQARIDDAGTRATSTTLDMRNNVVWGWVGGYGTTIWYGPRANVVNNYYASPQSAASERARALTVDRGTGASGARAYVEGNISGDGFTAEVEAQGNEAVPFPAAAVDTQSACVAAREVLAGAGVRPLDAVDQRYVSAVTLAGCAGGGPVPPGPPRADLVISTLSAPGSATAATAITLSSATRNTGTAPAGASTTRWYLSRDARLDGGDGVLGGVSVAALAAGDARAATMTVTIPAATAAGTWHVIARADAADVVDEGNEANNTTAAPLTIAPGLPAGTADLSLSDLSLERRAPAGAIVRVKDAVKNLGTTAAAASVTKYYLSRDDRLDAGDVLVGSRAVGALPAGGSSRTAASIVIPAGTPPGAYYVVAVADADGAVSETREDNNARARKLMVQ